MENEYDPIEDFIQDIAHSLSDYIEQRRRFLLGEEKLEALIKDDLVEVLTDTNGKFTYRMTNKGAEAFFQATGREAGRNDITFIEFISYNP